MKFQRQNRNSIDINLTPLIDVVFLLLIFFMVSTSFIKETHLTLNLPSTSHSAPSANSDLSLEVIVESTGNYRIDNVALANSNSETLMSALKNLSGEDYSRPLTITADAGAPYQSIVTLIDLAGKLGFARIQITTQDESGTVQ